MKIYKKEDLKILEPIISLVLIKMDKYIIENGLRDGGTCVMGEGLDIDYLPPRCRKPIRLQIIRQPFQGNNFKALDYARKLLKESGINVYYNHGRMD